MTRLYKTWFQINSQLNIDFWNLIQINSRLKKPPEFLFKSTHDSKKNFSECWFESTHDNGAIHSQLRMSFLGYSTLLLTWYGFFGLSIPGLTSYDPFWAFDSNAFPDKLIWIISWLKQYLGDLNRFNSWLKRKKMILSQLIIRLWVIPMSADSAWYMPLLVNTASAPIELIRIRRYQWQLLRWSDNSLKSYVTKATFDGAPNNFLHSLPMSKQSSHEHGYISFLGQSPYMSLNLCFRSQICLHLLMRRRLRFLRCTNTKIEPMGLFSCWQRWLISCRVNVY